MISWSTLLKFMINQNGSKESTPDVCQEYRGNPSAESSDESSQSEEPEPQSEKSLKDKIDIKQKLNFGSANLVVAVPDDWIDVQTIADLEEVAFGFSGVNKAYAIQAGRELRVIVESEKVSDEKAANLSFEISQKIQTDMTYPGQVKVTVIRETRAVNIAK